MSPSYWVKINVNSTAIAPDKHGNDNKIKGAVIATAPSSKRIHSGCISEGCC
jgi:hypothetical protein